jgi:small subunit ribosomal protein S6e
MFKINIGTKQGKTYHFELESEELVGKKLHEILNGKDLKEELDGYEFEITGASDKAGFTSMEDVEGVGLKKVLLSYGKGMKRKIRKEGKKKKGRNKPRGLRLRKTVRGNTISPDIIQINLKVTKEGNKKLPDIFEGQAQGKAKENRKSKRAKAKEEAKSTPKQEAVENAETNS